MNQAKQTVEWEILLPIVGVKFNRDITFGPFSIRHASHETLKKTHELRLKDEFWSANVLSVKLEGNLVSDEKLCVRCPRQHTSPAQKRLINGQMLDVVTIGRKECICVAMPGGTEPTDVVATALPLLEDTLSLLRLYIFIGHRGSLPSHNLISLQRLPHYSTIVGLANSGKSYSEDLLPGTRIYDVPIQQHDVDLWIRVWDFGQLAATVYRSHTRQHVTPLEEIMGASMIQFGAMLEETNLRDSFLRGATAVETLTGDANGPGGVSAKFRELGATLAVIATNGELASRSPPVVNASMPQEWEVIVERLRDLYKHRCHISHGSRRLHESDEDELFAHQALLVRVAVGALILFGEIPNGKEQFYTKLQTIKNAVAPAPRGAR